MSSPRSDHRRSTLAAVLALAVSAVACGETQTTTGSTNGTPGARANVLRYPRLSEHKTLDPMKQFDQASAEIITNVFDTILTYHYLKRPYQLVPNLVEKMPEKQADGVTYLFTLRDDVHFSDDPAFDGGVGRKLSSDDIAYSLKRFADANVNVKSYILIQGSVVGLDEFREQTKELGKSVDYDTLDVEGIRVLDPLRFTIRFTGPNPLALYPLAASSMSIVAKEVVEMYGEELDRHPVGTGPFRISQYDRRGTMILQRNPDYHGRYPSEGSPEDAERGLLGGAGAQLPFVDEVHLPLIEEAQPRMLRFRKGELDWIGIDKDNFRKMAFRDDDGNFRLKPPYDQELEMYVEPGLSAEYIAFNMKDELFGNNKALRQAIAYALDVDSFIALLLNHRGMPLRTIVPHPIAGSERDIDISYYEYDPEKAKQKLIEAGYPGGEGLPPIVFDYRSSTKDARQMFEFVRNELAMVGIKVTANFHQFSAYLKRIESGNFQVGTSGWAADYPDAENFYQLLYSKNRTPGPNMSEFENEEYDRLYEQSRFMTNGPERFAMFRRMAEIVREEVPVLLRYNRVAFGLHHRHVKNLKRNMMIDAPYQYIRIETSPQTETSD